MKPGDPIGAKRTANGMLRSFKQAGPNEAKSASFKGIIPLGLALFFMPFYLRFTPSSYSVTAKNHSDRGFFYKKRLTNCLAVIILNTYTSFALCKNISPSTQLDREEKKSGEKVVQKQKDGCGILFVGVVRGIDGLRFQ
ncbi:hypothetical protein [Cohnella sp.]|uniref:hypothetical protein n=1 Tax=Cohnella sp. TaxID=1883426 RepID=UPI00356184DB